MPLSLSLLAPLLSLILILLLLPSSLAAVLAGKGSQTSLSFSSTATTLAALATPPGKIADKTMYPSAGEGYTIALWIKLRPNQSGGARVMVSLTP